MSPQVLAALERIVEAFDEAVADLSLDEARQVAGEVQALAAGYLAGDDFAEARARALREHLN